MRITIDNYAFLGSKFNGKFTLLNTLKSIGEGMFYSASFSSSLEIPNDVTTISNNAFAHATISADLTLSGKLEYIMTEAFKGTKFFGRVEFTNSTTKVQSSAFIGATFYKTLNLPNEISSKPLSTTYGRTISSSAFQEAVFLESIKFPPTLRKISTSAFEEAQFTDTIILPDSLETIEEKAFYSCIFNTETSLTFGKSMDKIGNYAFQKSNLQSISFDSKAQLDSIGKEAFEGLFQLSVAATSGSLYSKTISSSAFKGDENINFTSITSETISENAFENCFNLVAKDGILILADGSVQEAAFLNCKKLNGDLTIVEPSNKEIATSTIGKSAFMNTGLSYLNLPHISEISVYAFCNCSLLQGPINETYEELFVDTISSHAFDGDVLLHYTTIKSEDIQQYAFYLCHNLGSNIVLLGKIEDNTRSNDNVKLGTLGERAFYSCEKLGNITFDISLLKDYMNFDSSKGIEIPKYCFAKSGLTGPLVIPHTVKTIEYNAFSNCPNIKELKFNRQKTLDLSINEHAFANSDIGNHLVIPKFVTSVGQYSFANTLIESLEIEGTSYDYLDTTSNNYKSKTTKISKNAFSDCKNLKTVVFGNESIEIEDDSFRGCHISSLQLGNINKIPNNAFIGMSEINTPIEIADSITSIGERAFSECSKIPSITISPNSSLTQIGKAAFYKCKKIVSIVIPPGVTKIDEYAFYKCDNLETISILSRAPTTTGDDGTTKTGQITIEPYAFYGCSKLSKTLTLPEGLTKIGEGAFQECMNLEGSLKFPYSLKNIEERAFMDCSSLTGGLTFDINVVKIGKYAFRGCSNLNENLVIVDYYDGDQSKMEIHEGAFYGCSKLIGDLNIPYRCNLEKTEEILDNKGKKITTPSINVFKGCSNLDGNLYLPETIYEIPSGTFCDCSKLAGEVKNDLKVIGNEAFKNCAKLTGSLDFSNYNYSKDIGSYAFYNCTGLNGQIIFKELSDVEFITIGEYAFYNCHGLTGTLNCTSLSRIGKYAFTGCSGLNGSLIFDRYLLKVGEYAFADCTGFSGTLSFRSIMNNELSIEDSAFKGCTGFKDGSLLFIMDRSDSDLQPSKIYYLKIERNAFEDIKFKDIRYIGRTQPDCDCDIGLPSRKGIHTSSNYEGKSFCGNPLHKSKLSGGAIAGIVIACIVVVAIIIFVVVYFILKNKKNKDQSEGEVEMNQDP
ncbi:hypothetical protein M9Y10_021493 [Tritrichomonas musculus]